MILFFKGLLLRSYGRISGHQPVRAYQILKNMTIGNKAYRYRLERISRDRVYIARLCYDLRKISGTVLFRLKKEIPRGHLYGNSCKPSQSYSIKSVFKTPANKLRIRI
jgi:hypothetical protein